MVYFNTIVISHAWRQQKRILSFACWPTLPVGFSRPSAKVHEKV